MDRKERIYEVLRTSESSKGMEASEISIITGIDRANVSRKLNELEREQRVIKLSGRPVRYLDSEKYNQKQENKKTEEFFFMIGENGSLKKQIDQAKSAIMYPPKGLRTLFLGPTGTGKTMFVERLFEYAKYMKVLDETARLVIFNCAEYADNPQLILAQLFGYRKGAFTGADRESDGLVEKAKGGILFLDEIHRLPPEGQEMLFMLMDRGIYRKLGEPDKDRKANVLIMGATTENIDKALLQTFLRRMPVAVTLPALKERPVEERLELIEYFFRNEQQNIGIPVYVSKEVIIALLQYECTGNIGQLRADIQMICAKAFLKYKVERKEQLIVNYSDLNETILNDAENADARNHNYLIGLLKNYGDYHVFSETIEDGKGKKEGKRDSIFADIIHKYYEYQKQGKSDKEIKNTIGNYLNELMVNYGAKKEDKGNIHILNMINTKVQIAVDDAVDFAELKLERKLSDRIRLGMKLHINYVLERLETQEILINDNLKDMAIRYPKELQVARYVRKILEESLNVLIPDQELWVLTLFLCDKNEEKDLKKVGLIVLAHGNSTATSMANVANTLFDTNICKAIDMPLYGSVEETLEKTRKMIRQIDEGKGVLLMTDMGSLSGFGEILSKEMQQEIRVVDMVSTILVVEAVRKALMQENDLDQIQAALQKVGRMHLFNNSNVRDDGIRTVITTCISGAGTARKLSEMIQKMLLERKIENVVIHNMDITNVENAQAEIKRRGYSDVIAVVGTVDLKLADVPYISIESLVMGNGMSYLEELLSNANIGKKQGNNEEKKETAERTLRVESLKQILEFMDAEKTEQIVTQVYDRIMENTEIQVQKETKIRFIVHVSCMIERLIKGEALAYKSLEKLKAQSKELFQIVDCELNYIRDKLGVMVPQSEIAYIVELFMADLAQ